MVLQNPTLQRLMLLPHRAAGLSWPPWLLCVPVTDDRAQTGMHSWVVSKDHVSQPSQCETKKLVWGSFPLCQFKDQAWLKDGVRRLLYLLG